MTSSRIPTVARPTPQSHNILGTWQLTWPTAAFYNRVRIYDIPPPRPPKLTFSANFWKKITKGIYWLPGQL